MINYILFEGNVYSDRKVDIDGNGLDLMISTEDFESVLINEAESYTSPEARLIDEQIFFYDPKRVAADCNDEEVAEFIHRWCICF